MGNMCCRRVGYSPNGTEMDNDRCHQQQASEQQQPKSPLMSNAYHNAGDDCAINELLEGRMDLDVVLPDGRKVRLTVERRTPMMDLLVQAASATKISPAGHTIHVYGDDGKGSGTLHYKPSTPIGSLDANTICIVSKKDAQDLTGRRAHKMANRPFEPTFRVQVHLPRNQLTVVRVSPRVKISELRNMVCQEKGLDTSRYQLVRPSVRGQPLSGDLTLAEYGSTEITLLSNSCIESHICNSTSHIMPYSKRIEEQKKKTGILRLLAEDVNQKVQRKPNSTTLQRPAPTIKVTEAPHPGRYKPKKRRPAPPPPPPTLPEPPFHSRQSSSDSSGYHEATSSFLHEEHCTEDKASSDSSGVSSLDAKVATVQNTKKRRAPPPPPQSSAPWEPEGGGQVTMDVKIRPPPGEVVEDNVKEEKPIPKVKAQVSANKVTENVESCNFKKGSVERSSKEGEAVTRVALVALSARIEQDVTQQEIASSIQAAFHSLDSPQRTTGPSLLAIKQRGGRTIESENRTTSPSATKPASSVPATRETLKSTDEPSVDSATCASERRSSAPTTAHNKHSVSSDPIRQPVTRSTEQPVKSTTDRSSITSHLPSAPTTGFTKPPAAQPSTPITKQPLNRAAEQPPNVNSRSASTRENAPSVPATGSLKHPTEGLTSISTGELLISTSEQRLESATLTSEQPSPCAPEIPPVPLTDSIAPTSADGSNEDFPVYPLQKSSARLTFEPKDDSDDALQAFPPPPSEFRGVENEAILIDDEPPIPCPPTFRSTPSKTLRRSSSLLNLTDSAPHRVPSSKSKKVRHLQRSLSDLTVDDKGEFEAEQERLQREYLKLQRQFILWQQQLLNNHAMLREECIVPQYARTLRQSHSLPEGQDYTEESAGTCPLVSRSLSYEPTKCSTLPRSTINIPPLEFGSVPISNGSSTLRSSKTKSYFKPPQVRVSTKNRQRLPPEIRKDGDLDIYDDTKILSTILPSFDSLKLISEGNDDDLDIGSLILKPTGKVEKKINKQQDVEVMKKVPPPVPNKLATLPKPDMNRQNNQRNKNGLVNGGVNGEPMRICDTVKESVQSNGSQPPPPPPLPVAEKSKNPILSKPNNISAPKTVAEKKFTPQMDPREQLMQEIRRCGGRTALRKISLDISS